MSLEPDLINPEKYSEYAAEIFRTGAAAPPIKSVDGLVRLKDGSLTMGLSGKLVPPGSYRVELYGVKEERRELVDTLTFTIVAP
jgi:hypothetical protein